MLSSCLWFQQALGATGIGVAFPTGMRCLGEQCSAAAVAQLVPQALLAGAAPALLLAEGPGFTSELQGQGRWWLLLGTVGWHVRTRLQGLGGHLHSVFLVWLFHVLVVQSLTP